MMSRQRRWQLAREAEGRCVACGGPRDSTTQKCSRCYSRHGLRRRRTKRELRGTLSAPAALPDLSTCH